MASCFWCMAGSLRISRFCFWLRAPDCCFLQCRVKSRKYHVEVR